MALNITGYGNYGRLLTNLEHAAAGNDRQAAVQAYNAINKSASYSQKSLHGTAKDQLLLGRFSKVHREQGDQGIARLTDAVQRAERASQVIRTRFNHDNGMGTKTKLSIGIGVGAVVTGVAHQTGVLGKVVSHLPDAPSLSSLAPNIPSFSSLISRASSGIGGYGYGYGYGGYGASLASRTLTALGSVPGYAWIGLGAFGLGVGALALNRALRH